VTASRTLVGVFALRLFTQLQRSAAMAGLAATQKLLRTPDSPQLQLIHKFAPAHLPHNYYCWFDMMRLLCV